MKSKITVIALFVFTALVVILYPMYQGKDANANIKNVTPGHLNHNVDPANIVNQHENARKIEVVFALDTTSSMTGLIDAAKEKIWSIASTMASSQSAPEIRMGLVAYRDRGDDYVTKVIDLSTDLDSVYAQLMDFQAQGGGDTPESVNQALYDAVNSVSWSEQDRNVYKVIFLVGDAPAHMDYQDDVKYPHTLVKAREKGIVVNTIQCGNLAGTLTYWHQIASLGQGNYFRVEQEGSAVAVSTPYDAKLAELSRKLDDTRLYYGSREKREEKRKKVEATDKLHAFSSDASRARRAMFNSSGSGKKNLFGENELVDDVASGKVRLKDIDKDKLPEPMQSMAPAAQEETIANMAKQRKELQSSISKLANERDAYLKKKVEEAGGAKDSLDEKIYQAVREQAARKGFRYDGETADY